MRVRTWLVVSAVAAGLVLGAPVAVAAPDCDDDGGALLGLRVDEDGIGVTLLGVELTLAGSDPCPEPAPDPAPAPEPEPTGEPAPAPAPTATATPTGPPAPGSEDTRDAGPVTGTRSGEPAPSTPRPSDPEGVAAGMPESAVPPASADDPAQPGGPSGGGPGPTAAADAGAPRLSGPVAALPSGSQTAGALREIPAGSSGGLSLAGWLAGVVLAVLATAAAVAALHRRFS